MDNICAYAMITDDTWRNIPSGQIVDDGFGGELQAPEETGTYTLYELADENNRHKGWKWVKDKAFAEDKQAVCDALLSALRTTRAAGDPDGNPLIELRYIPEREIVRPIFADGTGNDGWYDVSVA